MEQLLSEPRFVVVKLADLNVLLLKDRGLSLVKHVDPRYGSLLGRLLFTLVGACYGAPLIRNGVILEERSVDHVFSYRMRLEMAGCATFLMSIRAPLCFPDESVPDERRGVIPMLRSIVYRDDGSPVRFFPEDTNQLLLAIQCSHWLRTSARLLCCLRSYALDSAMTLIPNELLFEILRLCYFTYSNQLESWFDDVGLVASDDDEDDHALDELFSEA